MQKEHPNIAYSIGRGLHQTWKCVGDDPLPDRLIDLLDRIHEKYDLRATEGGSAHTRPEHENALES
jgi:hypothetical protein